MGAPSVSVFILTYNHKDFISTAIESVLAQKTDFEFEVVIGDDFSTDGTRDILRDYEGKNPSKIILNLLPSKGKGMTGHENFVTTFQKCKGRFISFLDGDDYWIDKDKLQTQYDFLNANSEYVMCHHDCASIETPGILFKRNFNNKNKVADFYSACQITFPFFSSVFVQKSALDNINLRKWLGDMKMGDFPLWVLITSQGKAYYENKAMGYYRKLSTGYSGGFRYLDYISSRLGFFTKLFNSSYNQDPVFIHRILSRYYFEFSAYLLSQRRIKKSINNFFKGIRHSVSGMEKMKTKVKWIERLRYRYLAKRFMYSSVNFFKKNETT